MGTEIFQMSQQAVDRLEVIQRIESQQISQTEGARLLQLTTRHVRRLQGAYRDKDAQGLMSKRRGQPSNNHLSQDMLAQCVTLIKTHYADFKPTFAHEKLTEVHKLCLSVESVRQLMIREGLWKGKKRKKITLHQTRERRAQYGELVQIDGSPHAWFEDCAPKCCLLVYIDDATSTLMQLYFTEVESTAAYFEATKRYLKQHGRPLAYYSDKHTIFRVQIKEAKSGSGDTQFSRAMKELDIELICAHSAQAKGRVERANAVLQDRLVKELRLHHIADIPSANAFLPQFIEDYNKRFAVAAANANDAHRQHCPDDDTLRLILSPQHPRKLSKNLELSYKNITYQIQLDSPGYTMRGATVTVIEQGTEVVLLYKQKSLNYKTIDRKNQATQIKDTKQIAQKPQRKVQQANDHPWKKYPLSR